MTRLSRLQRLALLPALSGLAACQQAQPMASQQPQAKPAAPAAQGTRPALWAVKDADTTIYLFGTFHMLKPGVTWFDGAVKQALDKSDTLVTEIIAPTDPKQIAPTVARLAVDPDGPPLSQKIPAADRPAYTSYTMKMGVPYQALENYYPWYVSMSLAVKQYNQHGLDPKSGAEKTITGAFPAAKPHLALETTEQQLAMLANVPEAEQVHGLVTLAQKGDTFETSLNQMIEAWRTGDAERLAKLMNKEIEKTPATANAFLYERNQRWADWIDKRMATPGTVFVAVGAGHLAGDKSVQDYLAAKGLQATRIQ